MNMTGSSSRESIQPMHSLRLLLTAAALGLAATSCSSHPIQEAKSLDLDEVPAALGSVRDVDFAEADDKSLAKAVGSLLSVLKTPKISTDERATAQSLLERGAEELSLRSMSTHDLEDLADSELPGRIAVPAGLRAAQFHIDKDDRAHALRLVQKLDQRYPSHAFRQEAGDALWTIADSYANDKGRRLFIFPYSNRAPAVFEYLSTQFPSHDKSDDSLTRLAEIYTRNRLFDEAIEKHRELVLWAPDSPFRVKSEAEIPRLRLADLDGPAYDRDAMKLSLTELEAWVRDYGGHELRPEVDRTMVDCLQRLADNDLIVADFYATVKNPEGARQHAERALEFAKRAGNAEQEVEIRDFLTNLDEIERVDAPVILDASPDDLFDDDSGLGIHGPADLSDAVSTQHRPVTPHPLVEDDEPDDDNGSNGGGQ